MSSVSNVNFPSSLFLTNGAGFISEHFNIQGPWWDIRVGQVESAMHSLLQGVLLADAKMCWIRRDFWRRARWLSARLKRKAGGVVNHYATHPKQTHGWWENTTCFCWQKPVSLPTHTSRHAPPHLKKKKDWKCWPCNGKCEIWKYHLYAIMSTHWTAS